MKILLANKFYYRRAGAENYLLDLEKALKNAGHQVAVFATNHPSSEETPWRKYFVPYLAYDRREGLRQDVRKFFNMVWSRQAAASFQALLADFEPDIVHLHNIYHHLSPSIIKVCNKQKIPVIQTLHDFKFVCPNYRLFTKGSICERCHIYRYWNAVLFSCVEKSRPASAAAALEMWIHRALKIYEDGIDRFITPSSFLRDLLIRWKKEPGKIVHIPNLVDLSGLPPRSPDTGNSILFVGRLDATKGAETLVEAAVGAPDLPFRIIGKGPEEALLRARVGSLGLGNVAFLGFQSREQVYKEMQKARAVVIPSLWHENFSTVALEAGAMGRAVVITDTGGAKEIIIDGKTGLLVPPGEPQVLLDQIRKLWYDPSFSMRLGKAAEQRVRALVDSHRHLARLSALYEQVIAEKAK